MQVHEQTRDAGRPAVVTSMPKEHGVQAMLGLQRCVGNAAVNRLIVQRDDDDELAAGSGGPTSLEDPSAAPLGFDPDSILSDMASGAISGGGQTPLPDDTDVEVQGLQVAGVAVQRDPPATGSGPSTSTKPAGAADLAKALAAWGPFKQALDAFKGEVEKSVAQTTSGKATPRSVAFTIAGLGAAVATAQPIPIKPYLSITLDPVGKQGVVTLDIGKLSRIPGFDGGAPAPASGPPGDAFGPGRF